MWRTLWLESRIHSSIAVDRMEEFLRRLLEVFWLLRRAGSRRGNFGVGRDCLVEHIGSRKDFHSGENRQFAALSTKIRRSYI